MRGLQVASLLVHNKLTLKEDAQNGRTKGLLRHRICVSYIWAKYCKTTMCSHVRPLPRPPSPSRQLISLMRLG